MSSDSVLLQMIQFSQSAFGQTLLLQQIVHCDLVHLKGNDDRFNVL